MCRSFASTRVVFVTTLVGNKDAYEYVQKLYSPVAQDRRIKAMKARELIEAAKASHTKLKQLKEDVYNWESESFGKKKEDAEKHIVKFKADFEKLKSAVAQTAQKQKNSHHAP